MAVDDINAKAAWMLEAQGCRGRPQGDSVGRRASHESAGQPRQSAVRYHHVYRVALTAQPIAEQNSVLLMNVGGTSNNLLDKPWLYNDQVMGEPLNAPLAQYGYDKGGRTAALLTSEDAYGKDDGIAFRRLGETRRKNRGQRNLSLNRYRFHRATDEDSGR